MGKGKRIKELRASRAKEKAPINVLHDAFLVVEDHYGTETRCVEAAAMLCGVGKHLGYELRPRPVSVAIKDHTTGNSMMLGEAFLPNLTAEEVEAAYAGNKLGSENLGHMIVTLDQPPLLMDPNLRQVASRGLMVPNTFTRVEATHVDGDYDNLGWEIGHEDYEVKYVVDSNASALLEDFEEFMALHDADYKEIARRLKSGQKVTFAPA